MRSVCLDPCPQTTGHLSATRQPICIYPDMSDQSNIPPTFQHLACAAGQALHRGSKTQGKRRILQEILDEILPPTEAPNTRSLCWLNVRVQPRQPQRSHRTRKIQQLATYTIQGLFGELPISLSSIPRNRRSLPVPTITCLALSLYSQS